MHFHAAPCIHVPPACAQAERDLGAEDWNDAVRKHDLDREGLEEAGTLTMVMLVAMVTMAIMPQ